MTELMGSAVRSPASSANGDVCGDHMSGSGLVLHSSGSGFALSAVTRLREPYTELNGGAGLGTRLTATRLRSPDNRCCGESLGGFHPKVQTRRLRCRAVTPGRSRARQRELSSGKAVAKNGVGNGTECGARSEFVDSFKL